ncbi:MAG: hypothetical protein JWN40_2287 [Phycisphaerales bacterium]|nr:hypothetical protein [Phycisphaerales bacterium]
MESSKEKIEAQLCAYVEGELDDAERAEIEQHLTANPQHKALIAELRAASGLLRDLPRIAAPIELNESLCGQIERGALLDPTDDHSNPARRVHRWPQLTAVAAVLILAVGLGLVIYYVLPPSGGHPRTQLAVDDRLKDLGPSIDKLAKDRDSDALAGNTRNDEKGKAGDPGVDVLRSKAMSESELASRDARQPTDSPRPDSAGAKDDRTLYGMRAGRAANPDLDVAMRRGVLERGLVTPAEVENVRKWINESLGSDNNFFNSAGNTRLYLMVSTPSATAANGQLAAYFKGNGIQYMTDDSLPAATPLAVANGRAAGLAAGDGEKFNYAGKGFGGGGGGTGGGAGPVAVAGIPQIQPSERPDTAAPAPLAPSAKPDFSSSTTGRATKNAPQPTQLDYAKQEAAAPGASVSDVSRGDGSLKQLNKAGMGESKKAEVSKDAISADKAAAGESTRGGLEGQLTEENLRARRSLAAKVSAASTDAFNLGDGDHPASAAKRSEDESIGRNNVIIARMNRRQLNELSAALSREQGQRAELKEFAPAPVDGLAETSTKVKGVIAALGVPVASSSAEAQSHVVDPKSLTLGSVYAAPTTTPTPPALPTVGGGGAAGAESFGVNQAASAAPTVDRYYDRSALGRNRLAAATEPAGQVKTESLSDWAAKTPAPIAGGDALHLKLDPMDEPVDVVIVVKADSISTGAAAIDAQTPPANPAAKPAPAASGTSQTSSPADVKK